MTENSVWNAVRLNGSGHIENEYVWRIEMLPITKSPSERLQDLARAYGGTRGLAKSLSVSQRTVQKYISSNKVPGSRLQQIRRRERYFKNEVPKREVKRAFPDLESQIKNLPAGTSISLNRLMPEGFSVFAFNFAQSLRDPRMKFVALAIERGLKVSATIRIEDAVGNDLIFRVSDITSASDVWRRLRAIMAEYDSNIVAVAVIDGGGEGL